MSNPFKKQEKCRVTIPYLCAIDKINREWATSNMRKQTVLHITGLIC